jgi:hypothetical protein
MDFFLIGLKIKRFWTDPDAPGEGQKYIKVHQYIEKERNEGSVGGKEDPGGL